MSNIDIIRAWKDEAYRNSLTPDQRDQLPMSPVGSAELNEQEMAAICGGHHHDHDYTLLPQTYTTGHGPCCSSGEWCPENVIRSQDFLRS